MTKTVEKLNDDIRQLLIDRILSIGNVKEVSSELQEVRGTIAFFDEIAEVYYISYPSGYVRRLLTGKSGKHPVGIYAVRRKMYQINPVKVTYENELAKHYDHRTTTRIMLNEPQRLARIYDSIIKFRG